MKRFLKLSFLRPFSLFCLALILLSSFLLRPVTAVSLNDNRINQLEFQMRSLQSQINQLQNQSPRSATNPNPFAPVEAPYTPGELTLDQQFDNLAVLVIELNQRVQTLEAQIGE